MQDYKLPEGYTFYGSAPDQTTFVRTGHTSAEPNLAIFDRKVSTLVGGQLTVPSYRARIIRGILDATGSPVTTRVTADLTIRWPAGTDVAVVKDVMARLGEILSDSDFQDDAASDQLLPREAEESA